MTIEKYQTFFTESKLDHDTDNKFKKSGDSDLILNDIISYVGGKVGGRTNVKGNELIYDAGSGISFIGKVEDVENFAIVIFLHKNDGNHSIVRFNTKDNSITPIITESSVLNFSLDYPINNANIVGDLLLWTDGYNPPRKINMSRAIALAAYNPSVLIPPFKNAYSSITDEVISAAKKSPDRPVIFRDAKFILDQKTNATNQDTTITHGITLAGNSKLSIGAFLESEVSNPGNVVAVETRLTVTLIKVSGSVTIDTFTSKQREKSELPSTTILNKASKIIDIADAGSYNVVVDLVTESFDSSGGEVSGLDHDHTERTLLAAEATGLTGLGYNTEAGVTFNNLREKQFRFCYRYIYDDNEKSNFSPFSEVLIPNGEELIGGFISGDQDLNNRIDFLLNTGSSIVDKIEIVMQDQNLGSWHSYEILDKELKLIPDNCLLKVGFKNDKITTVVDESTVNISDNFFPQVADTQEYLPTNELAYGRVKEGFGNIPTDIELTANYNSYDYTPALVKMETRVEKTTLNLYEYYYIVLTLPTVKQENKDHIISVTFESGNTIFVTAPNDWSAITTYPDFLADEFIAKLKEEGVNESTFPWEWVNSGAAKHENLSLIGGTITTDHTPGEIWFVAGYKNTISDESVSSITAVNGTIVESNLITRDKLRTYKQGAYSVGIKYSDDYGRKSQVQIGDDSTVIFDDYYTSSLLNTVKTIGYEIKHKPPIWATKYQLLTTKNLSESKSLQWTIDSVEKVEKLGITYALISINGSIIGLKDLIPKISVGPYVFNKGDQLRRIGVYSTGNDIWSKIADKNYYDVLGVEFDDPENRKEYAYDQGDKEFKVKSVEIIDENGDIKYKDNSQKILIRVDESISGPIESSFKAGVVIEVLTPTKSTDENFFFEVGDTFEIGNPGLENRYHKGKDQDQSPLDLSGTPATGILDYGDYAWRIRYNLFSGLDFPCIDKNVSDFYDSKSSSLGKIGIENKEAEQKTYNLIRHSGKYFDNTNVNDLNKFESKNYVSLIDRHGPIISTTQVGDALKVYQSRKTTSIYIGKTFTKLANGEDQLIAIDRTFGTINSSDLDYGCVFPESVLRNDRHVYFFDIYSRSLMRDSANGIEPISRYPMAGYFVKKSKELLKSGVENVKVFTGYDDENDLVIISFVDSVNAENNETLAFHEEGGVWMTFFSFIPDMCAKFGDKFFTAKDTGLYIHNSDNVPRCEFYGVKYPRKFLLYPNNIPSMVKTYYSMSIFTNKNGWSAPEIIVDPTVTYPRGMFSRLKSGKFKFKEGVAHADFMRNMLTKSNSIDKLQLASGDNLRGESISILLEENNDDEAVLREVDINFIK